MGSMTEKVFPSVTKDGCSLEFLRWWIQPAPVLQVTAHSYYKILTCFETAYTLSNINSFAATVHPGMHVNYNCRTQCAVVLTIIARKQLLLTDDSQTNCCLALTPPCPTILVQMFSATLRPCLGRIKPLGVLAQLSMTKFSIFANGIKMRLSYQIWQIY